MLGAVSFGNLSQPVKGWNVALNYEDISVSSYPRNGRYIIYGDSGFSISATREGNKVKYGLDTFVSYVPVSVGYGMSIRILKSDGTVPYIPFRYWTDDIPTKNSSMGNMNTANGLPYTARQDVNTRLHIQSLPKDGFGWTEEASPAAFEQTFYYYIGPLAEKVSSSTSGWNSATYVYCSGSGITNCKIRRYTIKVKVPAASYSVAYDAKKRKNLYDNISHRTQIDINLGSVQS